MNGPDSREQEGAVAPVTLSNKVTIIVYWCLATVGVVAAAVWIGPLEEQLLTQRNSAADSLAYHLSQNYSDDRQQNLMLRSYLSRLMEANGVEALDVRGGEHVAFSLGAVASRHHQVERVITIPGADGQPAQHVIVRVAYPGLAETVRSERIRFIMLLGGALLLFGVLLRKLLEKNLTVPLAAMAGIAAQISRGARDKRFDHKRNDEFGYLAGFINQALDNMLYSQRESFEARELAEVTLHSIGDGVITTDSGGRVSDINLAAGQTLGLEPDLAAGQAIQSVMPIVEDATGKTLAHPFDQCIDENRTVCIDENCALLCADRKIPITVSVAPIQDRNGDLRGAVLVFRDISSARKLQQELAFHATHDALTGIHNRREFDRRLQLVLEEIRDSGAQHALCYLDLDQFKIVNDTCGHAAGDRLLQELTAYLQASVRSSDVLARLGGDEFGVLLMHTTLEQALVVADDIQDRVSRFRFSWQDKAFQVGASIGLVHVNSPDLVVADIMSAADMACYAAKESGRNQLHVYSPNDTELTRRREQMSLVSQIHSALEENRFRLVGQPIVPVTGADRFSSHYEMLLRMQDSEGNEVSPTIFIPAAEHFHMMASLDRWVLVQSLQFLQGYSDDAQQMKVAINLSGQSLSNETFLHFAVSEISASGVDARCISFEITETAAISNLSRARQFIETLREYGCTFALDDFGTGVSSFGYLKSLTVDFLKIDGTFIRNLASSSVDRAMVRAINEVGHSLGMRTVAEFVETEAVFRELRALGVDYAQGYWLGKPEPLDCIRGATGELLATS